MFSPLTKKRWKNFIRQKKAKLGLFAFLSILFFSFTANIWSNSSPIVWIQDIANNNPNESRSNKKIEIFFPAFFYVSPQELGIQDAFVIDFKKLASEKNSHGKILFSLFAPNPWSPDEQTDDVLASPSKEHWLGTDHLGRDVFARVLYGTKISLAFSLLLWFFSYAIGTFLGALQGYLLGVWDFILERLKELTSLIPILTLIILVTGFVQSQSFWIILFLVLFFQWMGIASQVRAIVLSLRKQEFCECARALGGSHFHILKKHVLPNAMTPVITLSPFAIEAGISLLAVLDYLGFGLPPPTPSLGELLAQGQQHLQDAPWLLIAPVFTILCLLLSVSLIGQALRQAFDPRGSVS